MRENLKLENSGSGSEGKADVGSSEPSDPTGDSAAQPSIPASASPANTDRRVSLRKAVLEVRHPKRCVRVEYMPRTFICLDGVLPKALL